ncbi:hypothetical protein [Ancylobacter dichloromethanicus]|uniref:hypothetical protein n=1 Tax=Ancylobacter dichloromethanicus TaxID=518825 RepID=UPI003614E163
MNIDRRRFTLLTGAACLAPGVAWAENRPLVTVYKDPSCGCCGAWADHIAEAGFPTKVIEEPRINALKPDGRAISSLVLPHRAGR